MVDGLLDAVERAICNDGAIEEDVALLGIALEQLEMPLEGDGTLAKRHGFDPATVAAELGVASPYSLKRTVRTRPLKTSRVATGLSRPSSALLRQGDERTSPRREQLIATAARGIRNKRQDALLKALANNDELRLFRALGHEAPSKRLVRNLVEDLLNRPGPCGRRCARGPPRGLGWPCFSCSRRGGCGATARPPR